MCLILEFVLWICECSIVWFVFECSCLFLNGWNLICCVLNFWIVWFVDVFLNLWLFEFDACCFVCWCCFWFVDLCLMFVVVVYVWFFEFVLLNCWNSRNLKHYQTTLKLKQNSKNSIVQKQIKKQTKLPNKLNWSYGGLKCRNVGGPIRVFEFTVKSYADVILSEGW